MPKLKLVLKRDRKSDEEVEVLMDTETFRRLREHLEGGNNPVAKVSYPCIATESYPISEIALSRNRVRFYTVSDSGAGTPKVPEKRVISLIVLKFPGQGDVEYLVEMTEEEYASVLDRLSKPMSYPILVVKCIQSGTFEFSEIVFSRDRLSFLTAFHHDDAHP